MGWGGGLRESRREGESGRSTLICRGGALLREVAEGERGLEPETKGILEDERRPIRAGSWGRPRVKASLAGRVMMSSLEHEQGSGVEGGKREEGGGEDDGEEGEGDEARGEL